MYAYIAQNIEFYFLAGTLLHFAAWSPIVCRVANGVSRNPDEMPSFVWVMTLGIIFLYCSFIIAQCSSICNKWKYVQRICNKSSETAQSLHGQNEDSVWILQSDPNSSGGCLQKRQPKLDGSMFGAIHAVIDMFSLSDASNIVYISCGIALDLICLILLSLDPIREALEISTQQSKSEPWVLMFSLLLSWWIVGLALWFKDLPMHQWILICVQRNLPKWLKPTIWFLPIFATSLYLIVSNYNDDVIVWVTYGIGLVLLYLTATMSRNYLLHHFFYLIVLGVSFFFFWGRVVFKNQSDDSTFWVIGLFVLLLSGLGVMYKNRKLNDSGWVTTPSVAPSVAGDTRSSPALVSPSTLEEQLLGFKNLHIWAVLFHVALIGAAFLLGLTKKRESSQDYFENYVMMNNDTYYFTVDYNKMNETSRDGDFVTIDYCASPRTLKIYFVVCSVLWSVASASQHTRSFLRIIYPNSKVGFTLSMVFSIVALAVGLGIGSTKDTTSDKLKAYIITAIITFLAYVVAYFATLLKPATQGVQQDVTIESVLYSSFYKWVEYSFSASLMHAVILWYIGVRSAHELVLACVLLSASMLMCIPMDMQINRALSYTHNYFTPDCETLLQLHIASETPFVYLSFFSKGVLSMALILPYMFIESPNYSVMPTFCS